MKNLLKKKNVIAVIAVALLGWAGITVSQTQVGAVLDLVMAEEQAPDVRPASGVKEDFNQAAYISDQRRIHILYGDHTGGGHLYGTATPCKSEFPKSWNEEKIIKEITLIAANDNLDWEKQRNGYHVAETNVGQVELRVVKDRDNEKVITAYPLNTGRNPCPANDN